MARNQSVSRRTRASWLAVACVVFGVQCGTDSPKENFGKPRAGNGSRPSRDAATEQDARTSDAASGGDSSDGATDAAPMSDAATADSGSPSTGQDASQPEPGPSCGTAPVATGDFSRERLRSASAECASWQYCNFQRAAATLESRVSAYAKDPGETQLKAARTAWLEAMSLWSRAELFQFGPAASAAQSAGKDTYQGKGLRDRIYSWPATARCRVEEEILEQTSNIDGVLISGRGLFALEYVLFFEGRDTACAASGQTASDWNALGAAELTKRKVAYAAAIAKDVQGQADALVKAWADGGFKATFVSASGYPN